MGSLLLIFANSQAIHEPFLDFQKAVHESDKKNVKGIHPTMRWWLRVLCCSYVNCRASEIWWGWGWWRKGHDEQETMCGIYMLKLLVGFGNFAEDYWEIYNIWMWGRSATKMKTFILVDKTINGKESSFLTQLFPILLTFLGQIHLGRKKNKIKPLCLRSTLQVWLDLHLLKMRLTQANMAGELTSTQLKCTSVLAT